MSIIHMRTWIDITVGTPIYLVINSGNGEVKYERRKCIDVERNPHFLLFTYESIENDYQVEPVFGILKYDFENSNHRVQIKNSDASIVFYSDMNLLIEEVEECATEISSIINKYNYQLEHYTNIIDQLRS